MTTMEIQLPKGAPPFASLQGFGCDGNIQPKSTTNLVSGDSSRFTQQKAVASAWKQMLPPHSLNGRSGKNRGTVSLTDMKFSTPGLWAF